MDAGEIFANYIIPLIGILGVGGMLLIALKMVLNYRMLARQGGAGKQDMDRFTDAVEHDLA